MYSFTVHNDKKSHVRAKGISTTTSKKLRHQDYLKELNLPQENKLANRRIGYKLHKVHSLEIQKRGLCAFDDKRFLLDDGVFMNCLLIKY